MKVAVIRFPGSNCDQDALHALRDDVGIAAEYVWHESESLYGFEAVFIPGGFSYGDYLRCGAMSARAPIMAEVHRFAAEGRPVIGACNGFQILCETGLLPGALMQNERQRFLCQDVFLSVQSTCSIWTERVDKVLRIPIAHGDGRFVCDSATLDRLNGEGQVAFRYCDAQGKVTQGSNVNGSTDSIAGIFNKTGNVLGLMPHPERATKPKLGYSDGLLILNSLKLVNSGSSRTS